MLPAEKWYEYQTSYQRYGLDMKPKEPRRKKKKKKAAVTPVVSARDKLRMVMFTIFAGTLCVCMIVTAAYAAKVKYNTNVIMKESEVLQGEIDNLNVEIKSQNNIKAIEEKAKNQLGMVYPDVSQYVRIRLVEAPQNFALALKQQAYRSEV